MAAAAKSVGRPTLLDRETEERILEAVRQGNSHSDAAEQAGISPGTMRGWKRRGRAGEEPFLTFLTHIKRAQAEFRGAALGHIQRAGLEGKWQAFAWLLERMYPKRFARRDPPPVTVVNAGGELSKLSEQEILRHIEELQPRVTQMLTEAKKEAKAA